MKLDCDKYLGSSKVWLSLSLRVQACANEGIICSMDLRMFISRVPVLSEFPCWLELVSLLNNTVKVFPWARGFHKSNVPHSTRTWKLLLAFLSLSIMMSSHDVWEPFLSLSVEWDEKVCASPPSHSSESWHRTVFWKKALTALQTLLSLCVCWRKPKGSYNCSPDLNKFSLHTSDFVLTDVTVGGTHLSKASWELCRLSTTLP